MRWLFHVALSQDLVFGEDGRYAPSSLEREGFIHASYKERLTESAKLYFPPGADLRVLAIDPRRLDVPVEVVDTPRGPMPHVHGSIPRDAVRVVSLDEVEAHDERVTGSRIAFLAFDGMTLLDLVGPLDVLSRIASMGFDPTSSCEVVALTRPEGSDATTDVPVWSASGLEIRAKRYRPWLEGFDVLVVPGGPSTRALETDPSIAAYIASFPANRLLASVCTGALLLGAAGRLSGRRATTHSVAMNELARFGAVASAERVVDEGQLVTAGGVTSGIDLGLHLVRRLVGDDAANAIAARIELVHASPSPPRASLPSP